MHGKKEIGPISDVHLFREAYVGAIYNPFGKTCRVAAHGAGEVYLEGFEPGHRTDDLFYTVTQGTEILRGHRYGKNLAACYGDLTMFENFDGYRLIDTRSGAVVHEERKTLARPSHVRGFWIELAELAAFGFAHDLGDLFGVEQLLRIGAPFVLPCDRHDLGTLTTRRVPASIYLYETVPGGIGVADKALEVWPEVIRTGIRIADACDCRSGCPSCLMPSRSPVDADELDKKSAISAARAILRFVDESSREEFDAALHAWRPMI